MPIQDSATADDTSPQDVNPANGNAPQVPPADPNGESEGDTPDAKGVDESGKPTDKPTGKPEKVEFSPEQNAAIQEIVKTRLAQQAASNAKSQDVAKSQAAKDALAKNKDFEGLYQAELKEHQDAQSENEKLALENIRLKVAMESSVPVSHIEFLVGNSREEIEASASKLKDLIGARKPAPKTEGGSGTRITESSEDIPASSKPRVKESYAFQSPGDIEW